MVLTQRNHAISLKVGTTAIPGLWKTFSGGGLTSETTLNRPGGMADRQAVASLTEREPVSITRDFDAIRDGGLVGPGGFVDAAQELGWDAQVTVQMLNGARQPIGPPRTYVGKISAVAPPELDSESAEVQSWSVELTVQN